MGARISRFRERLAGKIAARGDRKARRHLLAARVIRDSGEGPLKIVGVTPGYKGEVEAAAQRHERKAKRIQKRYAWLGRKIRGQRPQK